MAASAVLVAVLQQGCGGPAVDGAVAEPPGLEVPEELGLTEQLRVAEEAQWLRRMEHEEDGGQEPEPAPGALADPESPVVMPQGDPQVEAQGWTPWTSTRVDILSDPAACNPRPSSLQVFLFARGTDGQLIYTVRLSDGRWALWNRLGRRITGSPAAVCQVAPSGNNRFDVYARGEDGQLHHHYRIPYEVARWESLGGAMAVGAGPAVAVHPTRRQDVFVPWQDGGLRYRFFQGSWSGWLSPLAITIAGDPAAVYSAPNRLDLFAVFTDGRLRHAFAENGVWQPWTTLPAVFTSSPEVISPGTGEMHLFGRAPDNTLVHMRYVNGVWGRPESLGGILTSGPAAVVYATQRIMVFARGTDGKLWYRAWAP